ncbi:MAG: amino acid adenylation domain-containing protein [Gammaproteobacteria bacterium]|nr:amino acid adenylation domain-containing protein [Gammaproteobacteria bacterium]
MINITSTFTADVMRPQLAFFLNKFTEQKVQFIYNQLFQQMLLPSSESNTNDTGLNVVLIRLCDLFSTQHPSKKTSEKINDLLIAFQTIQTQMKVPLLILITPTECTRTNETSFFDSIEETLQKKLSTHKNIHFITSQEILDTHSSLAIFDNFSEKHGHIPYTFDFYNTLATIIARKYSLLSRKPHKVIVLDCDGTLWNGIIEEDGIEGISIDGEYSSIQQFVIDCYKTGFLVCLCSKNSEASVLSAFNNHKDMKLNLEKHICTHRINWETKSTNIESIAKELDLGLDSFIFIDDNKIECGEVQAKIPEVLVIELPKNTKKRLPYLKSIWAFDNLSQGHEDENRTKFYQKNKFREQLKSESQTYAQFLKNLKIKTLISKAKIKDYERVFQLSKRTNQFNIFPNAMTGIEFDTSIKNGAPCCLIIHVSDKYGDYGLVGVLVYELQKDTLTVKSFFLSCRILGRGIEYDILQYLSKVAKKHHIKNVDVPFVITKRNIPAINFLKKISGKQKLNDKTHVLLSVDQIAGAVFKSPDTETPKTASRTSAKNTTPINDYLLEIAAHTIKTKYSTKKMTKNLESDSKTVKINLLEIFKRHHIEIAKKNLELRSLGIDSLKSVLIASDIYHTYRISINPFDLLEPKFSFNTLVKGLLKEIDSSKNISEVITDMKINVPLSQAQMRLWYDEKISEKTNKNNMFVAYEIPKNIEADKLERAFLTLINRHDVLRYSFFEVNDEPFIHVNPLSKIKFKVEILRKTNPSAQTRFLNDFKYKTFDLSHAPLLRVGLMVTSDNKSILLISIHHIIHDGWSLSILLNELGILYEAFEKGVNSPLTNEAPSYTEFSYWQKKLVSDQLLSQQKLFWEKYLHKAPKLELIYDHPQTEFEGKTLGKRINFKLDTATTKKLKAIAQKNKVTLYDLLASAFGLLLAHYSNQNDINFVTAFSGRHHALAGKTIGFFVNLVLLRFEIDPTASFATILKTNKKNRSETTRYQDLPFNEILQITGDTVSSKVHSFSQAGFIFQNYPTPTLYIDGKKSKRIFSDDAAEIVYDACQECRFGNMICFMQELDLNLHGLFEYNVSLFNEKTIQHIILAFKTLLKNIADHPTGPALNIELVSPQQKNILLNKWSKPSRESEFKKDLLSYFAEHVAKTPNKIAVKHNDTVISYQDLDNKSNLIAQRLQKAGVKKERPVGLFLEKNIEHIIAMLAVVKSGGCYVPIGRDQPNVRVNYIVDDVGLACIITDSEGVQSFNLKRNSIKIINIFDEELREKPAIYTPVRTTPNQLTLVLYTSGSTGKPKGVMIEQASILRLVKSPNYIKISANDHMAQTSSITFDAATLEIWGALLNGARLILIDKHSLLDANSFAHFLQYEKISILFLTTQLFHSYAFSTPGLFKYLKYLLVGGEAVLPDAVSNIFNQTHHPKYFINGYGPTENTTFSTTYMAKTNDNLPDPIPIGKPISGTEVCVLGKGLNPVPVGAPGKLYLSGMGLSRKYINLKQLNRDKFIHYLGKRIYDTGDIVTWQADGNLKYIGREDNQIKINGYRIELNGIEAHIEAHPMVEQAIGLIKNIGHHKNLVVYVLLKEDIELSNVNLYHYLKLNLPPYMLPTFYYQITNVPITNTGKVDKKTLAALDLPPITYTEYESPSSALQNEITGIYAQILDIDQSKIGINAEFFDLGGNSISALTLIHMLNDTYATKINFSTLYECSTIKLLSEHINHTLNDAHFESILHQDQLYKNTLKTMQIGSSDKIPLIFVHPIGGTGFCYFDLIKLLPKDQPCYIIQDPSIDADKILFDDIASMAEHYNDLLLNEIKSKQFILAGYSFGGMLSLEMAHQLEQKKLDDKLSYIITFDTWVVSNFLNAAAKEALKQSILQQYERVETNLAKENIDPKPWMELYYTRLQELGFIYTPPKINKKIILFKAMQQTGDFAAMDDNANYLDLHTSKAVDIHLIPGNHDSILQLPNVKYISDIMVSYTHNLES